MSNAAGTKKRPSGQLRRAENVETMALLAGGVAHDIDNQLLVILFHAELLRDGIGSDDPRRDDVAEILRAVERAQAVTMQLSGLARRQPVRPRVVDLNDTVIRVAKRLQHTLPANYEVVAVTADGSWPVLVDPAQLEQLVVTLAVNARNAMPSGGKLAIGIENVVLDGPVEGLPAGRYIAFKISVAGGGIAPGRVVQPFDPLSTAGIAASGDDPAALATCEAIARQAGGSIRVESVLGSGTTFTILLPRASGTPERAAPWRESGETLDGTETIVVVEDNATVRSSTARILRKHGYEVIEAANGDQALRLIQPQRGKIDLVITDVVMPYMTGTELAERLAISHPHLKVIFTTSYSGDGDLADLEHPVLSKPYPPRDLLCAIRTVLDDRSSLVRAHRRSA